MVINTQIIARYQAIIICTIAVDSTLLKIVLTVISVNSICYLKMMYNRGMLSSRVTKSSQLELPRVFKELHLKLKENYQKLEPDLSNIQGDFVEMLYNI